LRIPGISNVDNTLNSHPPNKDSANPGLKILVVDDEPVLLEYVRRVLQRCGHHWLLSDNGAEAWAIFKNGRDEIDLVLTDLVMPGSFGGLELARRIRQIRPQVPVLFMTGTPQIDPVTAKLSRDRLLLKKPFHPGQLVSIVEESSRH